MPPAPRNKKAQKFSFSGFTSEQDQPGPGFAGIRTFGFPEPEEVKEPQLFISPGLDLRPLQERRFRTEEPPEEQKRGTPECDEFSLGERAPELSQEEREKEEGDGQSDLMFEAEFTDNPTLTICDLGKPISSKPMAKPNFMKNLLIDTGAINKQYPIGGEYGRQDDDYLEQEIVELAERCVACRRGEKLKETSKLPKFVRNERFNSRHQNITTPSSKRAKNIEFSDKKASRSQPPSRTAHSRSSYTSEESRPESTSPMSTSNSGD